MTEKLCCSCHSRHSVPAHAEAKLGKAALIAQLQGSHMLRLLQLAQQRSDACSCAQAHEYKMWSALVLSARFIASKLSAARGPYRRSCLPCHAGM